jgi:acetyltransferase
MNLLTARRTLDAFFRPRAVAVIGATERPGSVGRAILWNLIASPFGGTVYPVNPNRESVLGIRSYARIAAVPGKIDLAIIVTPAATVPGVVGECADAGVPAALILSAGFREAGAAGAALEEQVLAQAQRSRMRITGPNCLGVMSPLTGLNATFAGAMARPGSVAFLSQSGALCTAILDWSLRELVGFSAFISVGSMLDVGWGDLIEYFADDPHTGSIVIYMESLGDARSFLSAAREAALSKPIIVIKAGRTEAAAKAAASHTGVLTGSDEVLDAAFRRSGVLRVQNIAELFYMSEVLAKQPRPQGPRLAIVTNAGGPGVLATDALISTGGEIADLTDETIKRLDTILPPHWSHRNPVDILGDAASETFAAAVEIVARDPHVDGLLVILAPQAMTNPTQTAEQLKPLAKLEGKPLLASWMGGAETAAGTQILEQAGIPVFPFPDTAARVFCYMWRYSYNLRALYETPVAAVGASENPVLAAAIIRKARDRGRTLLTEFESKELLAAYGIPTLSGEIAQSEDEAVECARRVGFPVVVKLHSETITHKTEVGGVHLNLPDEASVRRAWQAIESSLAEKAGPDHFQGVTVQPMISITGYELILGSSIDPQFGPVLLFGSGGQLVEVYRDRSLALPPLNTTLARRMMEQTKIFRALGGVRGRPSVDIAELEQLLVRFSRLVVEQPQIREIDINPLLASPERLIALDARVILHGPEKTEGQLPRPAIRPYPIEYSWGWRMKDGSPVSIRPISPEDEPLMIEFHRQLSDRSVYLRYFHSMGFEQRVAHERLARICFIDYNRSIALVAERGEGSRGHILGVGRLTKLYYGQAGQPEDGEFAIVVGDPFQRQGLGSELLRRLIDVARAENLTRLRGDVLTDNIGMQRVCAALGFRLRYEPEESVIKAELELRNS